MEPLGDAKLNSPNPLDPSQEPVYRVGAVARLANIPVETLRVWERRYGIVEHDGRRHRHRFYSVRDVRRLSLIKKLVDLGSPISSVARLSHDELQRMYVNATAATHGEQHVSPTEARKLRLILVGPALHARFAAAAKGLPSVDVIAQRDSLEAVAAAPVQADVLVVEIDTLQAELASHLDRVLLAVRARVAIIAYRFAATDVVKEFIVRGHVVQRAPLMIDSLEGLCAALPDTPEETMYDDVSSAETPPTPAARFDERTLARLANVSTDLRCECPRHVTEILLSLSAFENYSAQCASQGPEDSELHRHLGRVAARCRVEFEEALIYIARVEGITLAALD